MGCRDIRHPLATTVTHTDVCVQYLTCYKVICMKGTSFLTVLDYVPLSANHNRLVPDVRSMYRIP